MSSFIGIGFVFDKHQNIELLFSKLLDFLIVNGELKKISYSIDEKGDNWNEEIVKCYSTCEITSLMFNNFFGKINITAAILDNTQIDFDLSIIELSQGDYGFLIEIDIEQLFKVGEREKLEKCTSMIIKFCKSIFNIIEYRYSFCDHEVGIEYTWTEFDRLKECVYSVSIVPQKNEFVINLASWEIDGLTNRLSRN